jgi:hypothetical protein
LPRAHLSFSARAWCYATSQQPLAAGCTLNYAQDTRVHLLKLLQRGIHGRTAGLRDHFFHNADVLRGVAKENGQPIGYIGLQSCANSPIAFRRIQIKA